MQQFENSKLIQRRRFFGRTTMYVGLALTAIAAVIVFRDPNLILQALIFMLVGGLLSQIGAAVHNRFGREPRMDQVLNASLKGLDDRYATFHYLLGSDHVLVTPEGFFALIPKWEKGQVSYKDGVWYHKKPKGRFSLRNRVRVLRGIEKETQREIKSLRNSMQKKLEESENLNIGAMIVFIAEDTYLDVTSAPIIATHRKKFKDTIRSLERGKSIDEAGIRKLSTTLVP